MNCVTSGCSYSGNPATKGLCSSCYRAHRIANGEDVVGEEERLEQLTRADRKWQDELEAATTSGNAEAVSRLLTAGSPKFGPILTRPISDGVGSLPAGAQIALETRVLQPAIRAAFTSIVKILVDHNLLDFEKNNPMAMFLSYTRHSYAAKEISKEQLEFFEYLLSLKPVVDRLDAEQLSLAVYTHGGAPFIMRLLMFPDKIQVTKKVLDDAKFLCKRPQNIPTPERYEKIALVEEAFKARNEQMKQAREKARDIAIAEGHAAPTKEHVVEARVTRDKAKAEEKKEEEVDAKPTRSKRSKK